MVVDLRNLLLERFFTEAKAIELLDMESFKKDMFMVSSAFCRPGHASSP
jgi:hypothetical protein